MLRGKLFVLILLSLEMFTAIALEHLAKMGILRTPQSPMVIVPYGRDIISATVHRNWH